MPLKLVPPSPRSKYYRVRGTYRGVHVDRTTESPRQSHAQALLKKWEAEIERGELSGRPELTFGQAVESFVLNGGDDRFIPRLLKHFGIRIAAKAITQADIDAAAVTLYPKAQPSTRARQVYAPMSAILRHSGVELALKRPKGASGNRRTIWLRSEEFERVAVVAKERDPELAAMILLMVYTGMRLGEALALRCGDIDLSRSELILRRTKNGDPRMVYLPPRVVAALANHPRGLTAEERAAAENPRLRSDRVFRYTKNQALNAEARAIYRAAGVDPGDAPFHVLRHTWATWMVQIGVDLVATKAWRSETSARVYTHFVTSEEAKKADALPGAMTT
jgi:integrase